MKVIPSEKYDYVGLHVEEDGVVYYKFKSKQDVFKYAEILLEREAKLSKGNVTLRYFDPQKKEKVLRNK